ncbi:MAG: hypothetical protein HY327_03330 [Chloroflexi bacterium]|nr:hypothetical protein [Chloroflexota bacterium]
MATRVNKKSSIPKFKSEEEERRFWATHDSSRYFGMMREVKGLIRDARPKKKAISIRVDEPALSKLKAVAAKRGLGYQTLMRQWVLERLDKEIAA